MPLKNYFFIFYKFNFENAKLKYQRRFEERICASNFSFFFIVHTHGNIVKGMKRKKH